MTLIQSPSHQRSWRRMDWTKCQNCQWSSIVIQCHCIIVLCYIMSTNFRAHCACADSMTWQTISRYEGIQTNEVVPQDHRGHLRGHRDSGTRLRIVGGSATTTNVGLRKKGVSTALAPYFLLRQWSQRYLLATGNICLPIAPARYSASSPKGSMPNARQICLQR